MLHSYIIEPEPGRPEQALSVLGPMSEEGRRAAQPTERSFAYIIGLSAIAHAALGAVLLVGVTAKSAGSGSVDLEAISITVVPAADPHLASNSGPAAAVVPVEPAVLIEPAEPVVPVEPVMPPADTAPATENREAPRDTPQDTTPPPEVSVPAPSVDVAALRPPPDLDLKPPPADVPKAPDPNTEPSDRSPQPSQAGGAAASPATAGGTTAGQASASRGDMDRYAREVVLIIARNRPKGIGAKGQVTVGFTLSDSDGRLLTATVVKSSGSTKLDALALSVISKAKYPPPPAGMTSQQLTYRIPFTFE